MMTEKTKLLHIGVLFGGRSGEHEVSLMSARSVLGALAPEKYAVTQIGITHEGTWLSGDDPLTAMQAGKLDDLTPVTLLPDPNRKGLYELRTSHPAHFAEIDVFFPVLHGTFGEDGTLQGLFEMAEAAYVGAGVLGAAVGMDKGIFKDVMRANGIPVVDGFVVSRSQLQTQMESILNKAAEMAPYPLFVKPANMGSSVGVTKCRSRSDLYEGLLDAARFDRRVLIERGVNAREIEISVLGNDDPQASIPGEIQPEADFYSYNAKYHDDRSELFIPARIPEETTEQMRCMAIKAYRAIDCAGMARVDFLLDRESGEFYLNEVNTIPGFTQISMYPKLWDASGLPYPALIDRLIELALERRRERDQTVWRYEDEANA
jgi:D-alanine-D-alanine ligase